MVMRNVLSHYSPFLTSSFWSLEHLRGVTSSKMHSSASFFKNFSNRFLAGTHSFSGNSSVNGLTDSTGYQLRLVLRKMYFGRGDTFTYSSSLGEPTFTDFVYFFFYKQSKFWYNYRSAYKLSNFAAPVSFRKSSNFLAINLIDRVYSSSYISDWRFSHGRFLTKKVFPLSNTQELRRYADPRAHLNYGGFGRFEHSSEIFCPPDNLGLGVGPLISNKAQFGGAAVDFLHYSGVHLSANTVIPFLRLKMKIAQCAESGFVPLKSVAETGFLLNLEYRQNVLSPLAQKLVGCSIYFFDCVVGIFPFQRSSMFSGRCVADLVFPLLLIFSKFALDRLILTSGWWAVIRAVYLGRLPNLWRSWPPSLGFSLDYKGIFPKSNMDSVRGLISAPALYFYAVNTQLGRLVLETLLAPYFTNLGNLSRVVNSWRFNGTGRVVKMRTGVADACEQLSLEKLKNFQVSYNLLLHFFTFLKLSVIGADGSRSANLPRLAPLLIYFRRFLKNLVKYNFLFLDFFCILVSTSPRMYFDRALLQPKLSFSDRVRAPLAYSLAAPEWRPLLESSQNLSATVLGISDLSRCSLDLIRLGGSREHNEFFSLYTGRTLFMAGKFNLRKDLLNFPYLLEVGAPLNLEFLDTLVAQVFKKTSDKLTYVELGVTAPFDIDASLSFAFEFQGTWFFNEFDVVPFFASCRGVLLPETILSTFENFREVGVSSLVVKITNLKKKRQRFWEQVSGKWVRDPRQRVWSESSPEVLSGKVLIFKKPPIKVQWRPTSNFSVKASFYWQVSLEFNFFWF